MGILRRINNFTKSDEYRARIHDLIPGGAHTYSRGDDQFPSRSPAAISRGQGAHVWDLDDNCYLDCPMGLTSVSLGHAYPVVLNRVREELNNGVNFQRPGAVERNMAEAFLGLVPQHQMIKFAKNGSTVTTAAVKLARAATGRKLVAFPSDHPFYSYDDWFIGKSACNLGVPQETQDLSVTFQGCSLDSLKEVFSRYPGQIACVITEPERSWCGPNCPCRGDAKTFLHGVLDLCHKEGALFIVDEMITGFKTGFPGSIVKYGVKSDLATWGKGIANGFSFCALTGVQEVMELGGIRKIGREKLFLMSSTHGGETHAIAAGLATIEVFRKAPVIEHNQSIGQSFVRRVRSAIEAAGLSAHILVSDCPWMPAMVFLDSSMTICQGMRTLFMQEMIARGVLFQGSLSPCLSHTEQDMEYIESAAKECLLIYGKALVDGYAGYLEGPPAKPVFRKWL